MKYIIIITVMLISLTAVSQTKYQDPKKDRGFKLFSLNFHKKKSSFEGIDTVKVRIKLGHKINIYSPSFGIDGYMIRNGKKKKFLDCEQKPIPMQYVVRDYKIRKDGVE